MALLLLHDVVICWFHPAGISYRTRKTNEIDRTSLYTPGVVQNINFCSFLPIPVDNRKFQKKKKKRSVELRQSFLCTVWAFAEADDREKDSLKVGRIVLSTSAESTVVVHSSSLSYIAAAARRVVRRWCSSIYRTAR